MNKKNSFNNFTSFGVFLGQTKEKIGVVVTKSELIINFKHSLHSFWHKYLIVQSKSTAAKLLV